MPLAYCRLCASTPVDYQANNIEVCVDEIGFKLFDKLDKIKAKVNNNLLKVGKSTIKTIEAQMPTFDEKYTYSSLKVTG